MRPVEYPDEAIISAGQALQAEGRRITAFAIRQRIGGGDPVRIRAVWSDYLARCTRQTAEIVKETLPAEFAAAVEELNTAFLEQWRNLATRLYQLARDSAEARVREALQTARTVQEQAEAEMADAQQNALAQDARIAELTGQYEEIRHNLDALLQEQEERAQQLATLESHWQQAQSELTELRRHLSQSQAAAAAATGKAAAEVERRQQAGQELQAAQAQRLALTAALETERAQRQQAEYRAGQLQAALEQAQAEAAKAARTLEQTVAEQQQVTIQAAELRARVEGLEARLQAAEAARQQAEQHTASLTRVLDQLAAGGHGDQSKSATQSQRKSRQ